MNGRWAYIKLQNAMVSRMMRGTANARSIQHRILQDKIRLCTDSRFGRDHDLKSIRNVQDFRRQVPITDFEYIRPYVDDVRNGDVQALFSPSVRLLMFALTSGTTEQPKHIPITDEFIRTYKRGWKIWGLKTHTDHMDLAKKQYVHLAGDWQQHQTPSGVWCGSISGLAAETRPAVVRKPFVVPPQVGKISDWTTRQYTTLRLSLPSKKVGMIITANPLTLIGLAQLADTHKESLIRDMRDGTLRPPGGADSIDQRLGSRIKRVSPGRIRELEALIDRTGELVPRDFWPGLSVVGVWMGGSVSAFIPEVRQLYGDCAFRDHGLSASEGRMTIPIDDETNAGLLDYESNFYEFIPEDEFENDSPTILEAHELQEGRSYYVLLTNSGGLFRYNIHDVVQCVGFRGQTPLLSFLHKGAHCSSMTGEKVTEDQVATAVREGFSNLNLRVQTVMLVPVMDSRPYYRLLVEPHPDQNVDDIAKAIDRNLAKANCEYDDRIKTNRLLPIQSQIIPNGSWQKMRDQKIAERGGTQEQYKHTFLGTSDHFLSEL